MQQLGQMKNAVENTLKGKEKTWFDGLMASRQRLQQAALRGVARGLWHTDKSKMKLWLVTLKQCTVVSQHVKPAAARQFRQVSWRVNQHEARLCIAMWHSAMKRAEETYFRAIAHFKYCTLERQKESEHNTVCALTAILKSTNARMDSLQLELATVLSMAKDSEAAKTDLLSLLSNERNSGTTLLCYLKKALHEEASLLDTESLLNAELKMFAETTSHLWQCGMRRLCQIMLRAFRIEMQLRIKLWHSAWKAERLLRRAGARMLHKEAMHALQAFRKHFQNVKQADQAEQRMRRVGARMLNKEVVFTLQGFRRNLSDAKQAERAERTMRRVGARMLHKEAVFALQGFRRNLVDAKQAERAERIMRQVGARMLNKEVVFVLQTFRRKLWLAKQAERAYKIGIQQLCQMILRVSQGEMGLRIGLWHSALKVWKTERLTAMKAAADAQERKLHGAEKRKQMKKKQYMAVKALTMCMGRKDKDKMREWLALARLNQSECEHASLLTESMSRAGHQQLQTAAGCLSHVLSRLRQGMTRFCVQNWHDTTKAWALRQSFLKSHLKKLAEVNAAHQAEIKVKQARGLVRCMKHVDNRNQEKWIDRVKLRMVKSNCEQTMEKLTGEMSAGGGDMLSHA